MLKIHFVFVNIVRIEQLNDIVFFDEIVLIDFETLFMIITTTYRAIIVPFLNLRLSDFLKTLFFRITSDFRLVLCRGFEF